MANTATYDDSWKIQKPAITATKDNRDNNTGIVSQKILLNTAGTYVDRNIQVETQVAIPKATISVADNAITATTPGWVDGDVATLDTGAFSNTAVGTTAYEINNSANTMITSGGSLYMSAGYYPATQITLAHMIEDFPEGTEEITTSTANYVLEGYKAYDDEGNVITGSMAKITPTFSGGAIEAEASGEITKKAVVTVSHDSTSSLLTTANIGVGNNKPETGVDGTNYVKLSSAGKLTEGSMTAKADADSAEVVYSANAVGYLNASKNTAVLEGQTATQAITTIALDNEAVEVVDNADDIYIPIVKPTATVTGAESNAAKATAGTDITVVNNDDTHSPVHSVNYSSTAPTSGPYIEIKPTITSESGEAKFQATATMAEGGIVVQGTQAVSSETTAEITVTATTATSKFIPVYDGSWDVVA